MYYNPILRVNINMHKTSHLRATQALAWVRVALPCGLVLGFARFQRCRVPLPETVPKHGIGNKRHPAPKKTAMAPAQGAGAIFPASPIGADVGRAASATLPFFGCEAEKR